MVREIRRSAAACVAFAVLIIELLAGQAAAFTDTTASCGLGPRAGYRVLAVCDWDNDQKVDFIASAAVDERLLQVWKWEPDPHRFSNAINASMPAAVLYATSADFNRDGMPDIVAALADGRIAVLFQLLNGSIAAPQMVSGGQLYIPSSVNLFNFDAACGLPQIYAVRSDAAVADLITLGGAMSDCFFPWETLTISSRVAVENNALPFSAGPDLNGNCATDVTVAVSSGTGSDAMMELHTLQRGRATAATLGATAFVNKVPLASFGFPTFADWSGNGAADMLLPACLDARGRPSATQCIAGSFNSVLVVKNDIGGVACPNDDCCSSHPTHFPSVGLANAASGDVDLRNIYPFVNLTASCGSPIPPVIPAPAIFRFGDYNDDAVLDAVVASTQGPIVLTGQGLGYFECQLLPAMVGTSRESLRNASADPFFFDIDDDGRLDLLTTNTDPVAARAELGSIFAFSGDSAALGNYYLTALTVNGAQAPQGGPAWGAAVVGATHRFQYTDINQNVHTATATQATSSAASALQPVRSHFGLAVTFSYIMNYATGYVVGVEPKHKSWPVYLMPNSQIVVIAAPNVSPDDWDLKLFLYGARFMRLVLIAWLASLGVIGLPLVLLKARELQADRRAIHRHE